MKNATLNRDFLLGGRASFIVKNPGGEKYEFRVRLSKPKPNSRYGPTYFVSLVDAKHPRSKYGAVYMGILNKETGMIKSTYASAFPADSTPFKVAQWAISLIGAGKSKRGKRCDDGTDSNKSSIVVTPISASIC